MCAAAQFELCANILEGLNMADETPDQIVREIISEVFRIPISEIDDTSDLFELGLDSIMVAEVMVIIENRFGVEIESKDLFVSPSVSGLVRAINLKKANL